MLAKKQKLAIEKLDKKTSKTYNINAVWQCNCDLGLNFKANTPVFELAKNSELASSEKKTLFIFFFLLFERKQKHLFYYNKNFDKINKWKH